MIEDDHSVAQDFVRTRLFPKKNCSRRCLLPRLTISTWIYDNGCSKHDEVNTYRLVFILREDVVHILAVRGTGQDLLQLGDIKFPD